MEHRWEDTRSHSQSFFVGDYAIFIFRGVETASDVGIFSSQNTQGSDEPTITNGALNDIIGLGSIVNKLWSLLLRDLVGSQPTDFLWLGISWRNVFEVQGIYSFIVFVLRTKVRVIEHGFTLGFHFLEKVFTTSQASFLIIKDGPLRPDFVVVMIEVIFLF